MPKIWKDHQGKTVPSRFVPQLDKKKDALANKYAKKAEALSKKILDFKTSLLTDSDIIYQLMLEGAELKKEHKGNYTITSFSKDIKIEVTMHNKIEFDDNINLAQDVINEYLAEKTKGIDSDLSLLVNSPFTSTKGQLDTKRVLSLFKLDITHSKWLKAMELIRKSISTNHSKRYVRIFRKDTEGKYTDIQLNISAL